MSLAFLLLLLLLYSCSAQLLLAVAALLLRSAAGPHVHMAGPTTSQAAEPPHHLWRNARQNSQCCINPCSTVGQSVYLSCLCECPGQHLPKRSQPQGVAVATGAVNVTDPVARLLSPRRKGPSICAQRLCQCWPEDVGRPRLAVAVICTGRQAGCGSRCDAHHQPLQPQRRTRAPRI